MYESQEGLLEQVKWELTWKVKERLRREEGMGRALQVEAPDMTEWED